MIASASRCGSRPRTMTPPSPVASAFPGASQARIGRPRQCASRRLIGSPSQREVLSRASHAAKQERRIVAPTKKRGHSGRLRSRRRAAAGQLPRSAGEVRESGAVRGEQRRSRGADPFGGAARQGTATTGSASPSPSVIRAARRSFGVGASAGFTPFAITSTFRENRRPRPAMSTRSSSLGQMMRSARESATRVAARASSRMAPAVPRSACRPCVVTITEPPSRAGKSPARTPCRWTTSDPRSRRRT